MDIKYDPDHHRLRCNGHILNLAAQSFLFNTADEALTTQNNPGISAKDLPSEKEIEEWRAKGPLGKLHNLVVHIHRSPQRRNQFKIFSHGLLPTRDNSTRWNSWKQQIDSVFRPHVKEAIQKYQDRFLDKDIDRLLDQDWIILAKIKDLLQAFYDATLSTESRKSTLENVLPTMDFILDTFEKGKKLYTMDPFLGPCINSGWAKMNQYYSMTESSPVYIAALVLHPGYKWLYFEDNWSEHLDWISDAKYKMQKFWDSSYKPIDSATQILATATSQDDLNTFRAWEQSRKRTRVLGDEYQRYCNTEIVDDITDPRVWWQESSQRLNYPNLGIMALDILSIPAMSAEPERLFSGAKITITDRRNRIGIEAIEALECLKSWLGLKATIFGEAFLDQGI